MPPCFLNNTQIFPVSILEISCSVLMKKKMVVALIELCSPLLPHEHIICFSFTHTYTHTHSSLLSCPSNINVLYNYNFWLNQHAYLHYRLDQYDLCPILVRYCLSSFFKFIFKFIFLLFLEIIMALFFFI